MIQYVQQITNTFFAGTAAATLSVPINSLPAIGNTLVAMVKKATSGVTLNSVGDPRGNTWSIDVSGVTAGNGPGTYILSCLVVTPYQAGDQLTLTFSAAINDDGMITAEFSGMLSLHGTYNRLNLSAFNSIGTATSCNPVLGSSTSNPFALIISAFSLGGGVGQTITGPSGYTILQTAGGASAQQMSMAFQIAANTTGTFSNTWSWPTTAGGEWAMAAYHTSKFEGSMNAGI